MHTSLVEITGPRAVVTAKDDFMDCYRSIWVSYLLLGPFWDVIFFCEDKMASSSLLLF